jgi:hypothetical protein
VLNAPLCSALIVLLFLVFLYFETHAEIGLLSLIFLVLFVGYVGVLIYFAVRSIVSGFQRRSFCQAPRRSRPSFLRLVFCSGDS